MSASPPPRYVVVERDLGRGPKLYIFGNEEGAGVPSGGPYASREEAEAEVERRYQEMSEFYDAVEAEARKGGYSVQW